MMTLCSNPRFISTVRGAMEALMEMLGFPTEQRRCITPDPNKLRGTASRVYIKDEHILGAKSTYRSFAKCCPEKPRPSFSWTAALA